MPPPQKKKRTKEQKGGRCTKAGSSLPLDAVLEPRMDSIDGAIGSLHRNHCNGYYELDDHLYQPQAKGSCENSVYNACELIVASKTRVSMLLASFFVSLNSNGQPNWGSPRASASSLVAQTARFHWELGGEPPKPIQLSL